MLDVGPAPASPASRLQSRCLMSLFRCFWSVQQRKCLSSARARRSSGCLPSKSSCGDLEQAAAAATRPFYVVTFRAVAPVLEGFSMTFGSAASGFGQSSPDKGRVERSNAEIDDVRRSTGDLFQASVVPVTVPFLEEERCLVILRASSGDDRY